MKQVTATSSALLVVAPEQQAPLDQHEGLDDRCRRLREEWTAAEFQRMTQAYSDTITGVGAVSGNTGQVYHVQVEFRTFHGLGKDRKDVEHPVHTISGAEPQLQERGGGDVTTEHETTRAMALTNYSTINLWP